MKRLIPVITLGLVFGLILGACSFVNPAPIETPNPELTDTPIPSATLTATTIPPTATITPTSTPSPTPTLAYPLEGYGPDNFPQDVNSLTGLYISDPDLLLRRPVSFKINIIPRYNRPPWGLSLADIVYDFYHNDGYTRFHAIFYGNDAELVGPIRSARFPDDLLVRMYQSIFAYGSADSRINYRLFSSNYSDRLVLESGQTVLCPPVPSSPLCREDPNGYNFLLGGTREIHAFIKSKNVDDTQQNLNGMLFRLDPPSGGEAGMNVTTRYSGDSYNRWEFDASSGVYLRYQDDIFDEGQGEKFAPMIDRLNEQQLSAANVVILLAPHEYFQRPPAEIVEILLSGNGLAYALRDGKVYETVWNHPTLDSVLYLTFPDGSLYPFKPGNTWFQIVGQSSPITQTEAGSWRFEFHIP